MAKDFHAKVQDFADEIHLKNILNMMKGRHFSICPVTSACDARGIAYFRNPVYQSLQKLHTTSWSEFPPKLRREVAEKCLELAGYSPTVLSLADGDIIDIDAHVVPEKDTRQPLRVGIFGKFTSVYKQ